MESTRMNTSASSGSNNSNNSHIRKQATLTAKASGLIPFSNNETHNDSWLLSRCVFYHVIVRLRSASGVCDTPHYCMRRRDLRDRRRVERLVDEIVELRPD